MAAGAVPAGAKRAVVTVDYFDAGAVGMALQYDSQSNIFTGAAGVALKGTGTWRSHQFELADIRFADRANGADFRLDVQATADNMPPVCFSRISVEFTDAPLLDITSRRLLFTQGADQGPITFASAAGRIGWTVGDPNGVPLKSGTAQVTDGRAALDIKDLGPGYYTLTATADSGAPVTRTTSFGVVAPLPAKDPYYAVAMHYGWQPGWEDALIDSAATVGWSEVRSDANWAMEKEKGVYDSGSSSLDAGLKNAAKRGIRTMPILGYRNPLYDGGKTPSTPEGLAAFARFAAAAYAPYTNDFSVYNEYNSTGFNDGACGITAKCYYDMVKAVKQAMPDANLVGPTSAGTQLAWHDDFIARGGLDHLDTFSVNYYSSTGDSPSTPPEEIKALGEFAQLVKKVEARKKMPVWVTENGWPTHTDGHRGPQPGGRTAPPAAGHRRRCARHTDHQAGREDLARAHRPRHRTDRRTRCRRVLRPAGPAAHHHEGGRSVHRDRPARHPQERRGAHRAAHQQRPGTGSGARTGRLAGRTLDGHDRGPGARRRGEVLRDGRTPCRGTAVHLLRLLRHDRRRHRIGLAQLQPGRTGGRHHPRPGRPRLPGGVGGSAGRHQERTR
ncbi:hypothetical protein ABZ622_19610 [Streptomyces sp. NPDC007164]|uniref:hypothetical protein n=1 Tax=Streptomyces sp. NPDC007164 TaxID=3156918 RepID=UPI00340785BF